ncbi:MAG: protoporphyrinogen IX oxidase [Chitinophagaceae bacterium]|nr:MAG: protoporphyrinogen IX oxidase [Chitinophagaceae bacterium]
MAYFYLKALHIIFVVTWFAGLFYMPRLLIYNVEANGNSPEAKSILQTQYAIMMKRLWYGITWPSAIITLIFGISLFINLNLIQILFQKEGLWILLKLIFVVGLYAYHLSIHIIFKQQISGQFKYNSTQLRIWNEVATLFLLSIVFLVVVKQGISIVWGLLGLITLMLLFLIIIKIYKKLREKN